ncbi:uncharacterized protein LOC108092992 isoform X1 [Drosophila ficusphila]|uniref:uncharacterized protein LOC108092992 isoform X1 n=1 Tax=Drosophila ficusphila TaxID=30025 RepID=UPI0007E6D3FA|nr:uncharacterized protein LOC108092992 isoform X1 [Drosophila ficusphila]
MALPIPSATTTRKDHLVKNRTAFNSFRGIIIMDRKRHMDTSDLVVMLPYKKCRCLVCGKVFHSNNIKRHYTLLHPDVVLQRPPSAQKQPKHLKTSNLKVGRPQVVDTGKLCEVLPGGRRLNNKEATQSANTIAVVTTTESLDDEDEGDKENEDNGPGSQFHSIFIGKTELADEHDLSDESTTTLASSSTYGHTIAPAPAPTAARLEPIPVNDPTSSVRATPSDCPLAGEDAFYLRYLGNKLGKYSARTRSTVQFQINRILYKADLGCFEQADPQIDESDI